MYMKTVFHIVSHFDVGGAEQVAANIASDTSGEVTCHVVELIRAHGDYSQTFMQKLCEKGVICHRGIVPDIRFHYLFERLAAFTFPLWFVFLFMKYRPAVIHSHTEMPDLAVFSFFKIFSSLTEGCKVVRTIHNTQLWTGMKGLGKVVERFFIKRNSNVAISLSVRDNYYKEYGQYTPIIYNGVEKVVQKTFHSLENNKTNVLFAGRFEQQKGIVHLVEIIKRMESDTHYFFHIIGDGSLKDMISPLKSASNVRIYPPLYGLASYLGSFDYLLMPSEFEGLSILSIEASMSGLPVIANDCPGLKDTLPDNWVLKVHDNNIEQYMHIFKNVIPSLQYKSLSLQAQEFAEREFGINKMQEAYRAFYFNKV